MDYSVIINCIDNGFVGGLGANRNLKVAPWQLPLPSPSLFLHWLKHSSRVRRFALSFFVSLQSTHYGSAHPPTSDTHSHTHTQQYLIWYRREKKGARTHLNHERDEQHNISWESARMVKEVYEKEMVGDVWWSTLGHRWWRLRRRRATLFNAFAISPSYIYIYIYTSQYDTPNLRPG